MKKEKGKWEGRNEKIKGGQGEQKKEEGKRKTKD
jgi:hypothetical protein